MVYLFLYILGICWGSFANVLIDRSQAKKTIKGRSKCDHCGYTLSWFDNIPIFSFFFLKGRCKKCHKKLSWQYPVVEMITGLVFVAVFWLGQKNQLFQINVFDIKQFLVIAYYLAIVYIGWVILIWDFKYMIIPDNLVFIGIGVTFLYKLYETLDLGCHFYTMECSLLEGLAGGLILSGFFGFLYLVSKGRWIGGGDVKLGFLLGFLVEIKLVYFLVLFSYVSGALVAIFLVIFRSKRMKSEIPFGPFLVLSAYFVVFYQDLILKVWQSFIY